MTHTEFESLTKEKLLYFVGCSSARLLLRQRIQTLESAETWDPFSAAALASDIDAEFSRMFCPQFIKSDHNLVSAAAFSGKRHATPSVKPRLPTTRHSSELFQRYSLERLAVLGGQSGSYCFAQWSPGGSRILTVGRGECSLWDASDEATFARSLRLNSDASDGGNLEFTEFALWSPTGRMVLTASRSGALQTWESNSGKALTRFSDHTGSARSEITFADWSSDENLIISGDANGKIRIWNALSGAVSARFDWNRPVWTWGSWSVENAYIMTNSVANKIWDYRTGLETRFNIIDAHYVGGSFLPTKHFPGVKSSPWCPSDPSVLFHGKIWEPPFTKGFDLIDLHGPDLHTATWSADGTQILTAGRDGMVSTWDRQSKSLRTTVRSPRLASALEKIHAWSPDSSCMATIDGSIIQLWDMATGRDLCAIDHPLGFPFTVAWSPDGTQLLTVCSHQKVRIWGCKPGKRAR